MRFWDRLRVELRDPERRRIILLLGAVLALDGADKATVGAVAPDLERSLGVSNTELGLLVTASLLVGALATVPVGVLTDRTRRTRLLWVSIVLWSVAMLVSASATSYEMLILGRVALGAVTATAGPTVASLVGDFFAARERARVYGTILVGQIGGSAAGLLIGGYIAGIASWRWSFAALAIPGLVLAVAVARRLPEPARGGSDHLEPVDLPSHRGVAAKVAAAPRIEPRPELVLDEDPVRMRIATAVRYVLRVRTNVLLIVASALGYYLLAGARTFAVVFIRGHFGVGQAEAVSMMIPVGIGALCGVLIGGRVADRLIRRGRLGGRIVVGAAGYLVAALLFAPAFVVPLIVVAIPLFALGAAAFQAVNPPLDAARLDIMHPHLWGRAEGVRTLLRTLAEALAPVLFGWVSVQFGAVGGGAFSNTERVGAATAQGLEYTFLVMLVPLAVAGLLVLWARRTYPADVATVVASREALRGESVGVRA